MKNKKKVAVMTRLRPKGVSKWRRTRWRHADNKDAVDDVEEVALPGVGGEDKEEVEEWVEDGARWGHIVHNL